MEATAAEPTAKSRLRVCISARERGHTEYQQSSQQQISNSLQQVFHSHDHALLFHRALPNSIMNTPETSLQILTKVFVL
jgi:protein gp37